MSDPNLDDLRRNYKFTLDVANRCESCRHARPRRGGAITTHSADCVLLNIAKGE